MTARIAARLLRETDKRVLWKFVYNFGWKGMLAANRFIRRRRRGEHFPAFAFISVTSCCNLRCQGCWIPTDGAGREMSVADADAIITSFKARGVRFFGILGGEPFLHSGLFDILGRHPDCYFQVFTNGTVITDEAAREMRRLGNITPLISIEGLGETSDTRRGGRDVYARALEGVERCRRERLVIGAATSVCQSNYDELVRREFLNDLVARGVHYQWYYIYRPVGPEPTPELALTKERILGLRRFMVTQRLTAPLIMVDAYWDAEGRGLCPAATGISYHINPVGDVEPCPPIQFARENLLAGGDVYNLISNSEFLRGFEEVATKTSRGCILLEDPARLLEYVRRLDARDTSGRDAFAELAAMSQAPSHDIPGEEIPEESRLYRFAKKRWFFGFGAYG